MTSTKEVLERFREIELPVTAFGIHGMEDHFFKFHIVMVTRRRCENPFIGFYCDNAPWELVMKDMEL